MAEYIEREAVKEAIGFVHLHFVACGENKSLLDVINEIPAADVAPVRNERWLYHTLIDGHIHAECSECHKTRIIDNFCPNCGAKMDEDAFCNRMPE